MKLLPTVINCHPSFNKLRLPWVTSSHFGAAREYLFEHACLITGGRQYRPEYQWRRLMKEAVNETENAS